MTSTFTHFAQKIDKNDLFNTWHLDKYADEEDYYKVPKIEQGDYINLKEDMTFELKTEGEIGKGTWMLNTNGTYITTIVAYPFPRQQFQSPYG